MIKNKAKNQAVAANHQVNLLLMNFQEIRQNKKKSSSHILVPV